MLPNVRETLIGELDRPSFVVMQNSHATAKFYSAPAALPPADDVLYLFSPGAILYQMAVGDRPFEGDTQAVVFDAILNRDSRPLE